MDLNKLLPPILVRSIGEHKWEWGLSQINKGVEPVIVEETFTEGNRWRYVVQPCGRKEVWNYCNNAWTLKSILAH